MLTPLFTLKAVALTIADNLLTNPLSFFQRARAFKYALLMNYLHETSFPMWKEFT
jgi:hypothetical protein